MQLPGYAPGLTAIEGAWSVMKSGLRNHAARNLDELEAIARSADPHRAVGHGAGQVGQRDAAALHRNRPGIPAEKFERLRELMNKAVKDCPVSGYEPPASCGRLHSADRRLPHQPVTASSPDFGSVTFTETVASH